MFIFASEIVPNDLIHYIMKKKIFKVSFTFWSDEKDVRSLVFHSPSALQGALVALAENIDVELLDVDIVLE